MTLWPFLFSALALVVLALAVGGVLRPLLRRTGTAALLLEAEPAEETAAQVRAALREIEQDYALGKLTAADYADLRARALRQALALLETPAVSADPDLEAEIARRRRRRCPRCGQALAAGDCPSCRAVVSKPPGRARWLWLGAGLALLFALGVGGLVVRARQAQVVQPIGRVAVSHSHVLLAGPGGLYLGHHEGLLRSADGRTWTPLPVAGDVMGVAFIPPTTLVLLGHDLALVSPDNGATWQPLRHNLPGTDVHALAQSPRDPRTLYAFVVGHGLFRSGDAGITWTLVGDRLPETTSALAVAPGEPEVLFAGTAGQGVLVSEDGGRTWANANGFAGGLLPGLQVTALIFDPQSGDSYVDSRGRRYTGALYAATDGGLARSLDYGGAWSRLGLRAPLAALAHDGAVLYAVDQAGNVYRSRDRGVTWSGD